MKEESVIAEIKKAAKATALLGPDTVQVCRLTLIAPLLTDVK